MSTRIPPQDLASEVAVLGSLLLDPTRVDEVRGVLTGDAFYREGHRVIYEVLLDLSARGVPADTITLFDALRVRGQLDSAGGADYLARLAESVPTPVHAVHYAKIVRDLAIRRAFISTQTTAIEEAYAGVEDVGAFLAQAECAVGELRDHASPGGAQATRAMLQSVWAELARRNASGQEFAGLATGLGGLDKMISGLQATKLYYLAARPGVGKTALAMQAAVHVARRDVPVLFFSLEMSARDLMERTLCQEARVSSETVRGNTVDAADIDRMYSASDALSKAALWVDETAEITLSDVAARCRQHKRQHGLGLVVVDYLQLMGTAAEVKRENREQQVGHNSRGLKSLAKQLDVPVLVLSQISRESGKRKDPRPLLSDLRESGSIEQDADTVIFIHDSGVAGEREIKVAKQRNGPMGLVYARWTPEFTRFSDAGELI